ncbi:MAG: hypothetical protein M1828_004512 [Chrysothrix sp. TS-e1954]|nr:MAG: hypothetical protein M1828_004512 [Chrysothrix sp. TS-e1954]
MLDSFEILTSSGIVLWSKSYAPIGANIINSLIKDVFIEERVPAAPSAGADSSAARNPTYKKDKYSLKWTTAKDLGLIFVHATETLTEKQAVYQSLIQLSWIDELLDNVKTLFTKLYGEQFQKPHNTVIDCPFDEYFDLRVQELEKRDGPATRTVNNAVAQEDPSDIQDADSRNEMLAPPLPTGRRAAQSGKNTTATDEDTTSTEATPIPTPDSSRPTTPSSNVLAAKATRGGRASRRNQKANKASLISTSLSAANNSKPPSKKKGRRWDDDGLDGDDETPLDYSTADVTTMGAVDEPPQAEAISQDSWAKKTASGEVILKDLDEEMHSILASADSKANSTHEKSSSLVNSSLNSISTLFWNVVGGKVLTDADLVSPLKAMEDHLLNKNVARDAALQLCNSVSRDLVGTKTPSFQSIDATIRSSMDTALSRILTPSTPLDLLRSIDASASSATKSASSQRRPYVISVVGVNGVGKSTTLAKLAFLLLHNNLRVLVAAADTFRSGAVEQLRVHVRNLQSLVARSEDMGAISLFERGYGRDAASIAREAVAFGTAPTDTTPYDVILIDTAGRRHNDTRLMSSLAPFASACQPNKILMVCEALVGTDSVAQARHFNESFGANRGLDGFIVSKCDTVGGMVGTLVSLVWSTGVPIVAVGVGQHYGDLRGFGVGWARERLLSA